jgi:hypothetical protein
MLEVRIKLDKMLKDQEFLSNIYILSNDFLQIFLALKQFDPYMMTSVWIRYNSINLDIGCYMLVKLTILKIMSLHF